MRHNVVVRQDITDNFLTGRVRFNHSELLLQLLLRRVSFTVREGDACQDCKQAELLPSCSLQTTDDSHTPFILFLHIPIQCCVACVNCGALPLQQKDI